MLGHHIWVTAHYQVAHMYTCTGAYDFLVAKPNLSQAQSFLSCVQVLCTHCAKTSAEQKQSYNVRVTPLKLSTHAKRSTLYTSGSAAMWWTKFSQLNGLQKIIIVLDGGRDTLLANHKSTSSLRFLTFIKSTCTSRQLVPTNNLKAYKVFSGQMPLMMLLTFC